MTTYSPIHTTVMRRVHTMHALRPFVSSLSAAVLLFAVAVWGIGREVWVAHVMQNMPSYTDVAAFTHFALVAFMDTRFVVQVLSVLALAAFAWLVWDATRMLRHATRFA